MIGLAVAAAVIAAILLLRVGAAAEYSDGGFTLSARIGFVDIALIPRKKKVQREKTKKDMRERQKKPGSTTDVKKLVQNALSLPGKIRRRILIKELTVRFTQGGGDPFSMAMGHGGISAAMGVTQGALESAFRVKRYDLRSAVDFSAAESKIYLKASVCITVASAIYLAVAALRVYLGARVRKNNEAKPANELKT